MYYKKKMSNKLKYDSLTIEPTNNSSTQINQNSTFNHLNRQLIKKKLLSSLAKTRNLNSNSFQTSQSYNISPRNNQKRINDLKIELNLNIIPPLHKEKMLTKNEILYNKYNYPKLGPYIRKNNYIPYTNIISPFSLQSRKEFFYKKIFFNYINQQKKKMQEKFKPIDNKLNINYAENIEQYNEKLEKKNLIFLKEGKKIKHKVGENYCEKQTKKMNHSTNFIRCIIDYAYPDMILYKTKIFEETFKKKFFKLPPFVQSDKDLLNKENQLKDYLSQALVIK